VKSGNGNVTTNVTVPTLVVCLTIPHIIATQTAIYEK